MEIITNGTNIKRSEQSFPKHTPIHKCTDINLIRKVIENFVTHIELGQM